MNYKFDSSRENSQLPDSIRRSLEQGEPLKLIAASWLKLGGSVALRPGTEDEDNSPAIYINFEKSGEQNGTVYVSRTEVLETFPEIESMPVPTKIGEAEYEAATDKWYERQEKKHTGTWDDRLMGTVLKDQGALETALAHPLSGKGEASLYPFDAEDVQDLADGEVFYWLSCAIVDGTSSSHCDYYFKI